VEQKLVGVLLGSAKDEGREFVTQSVPATSGTERVLAADDMSGGSDQEIGAGWRVVEPKRQVLNCRELKCRSGILEQPLQGLGVTPIGLEARWREVEAEGSLR
jgi:hypothetical protein